MSWFFEMVFFFTSCHVHMSFFYDIFVIHHRLQKYICKKSNYIQLVFQCIACKFFVSFITDKCTFHPRKWISWKSQTTSHRNFQPSQKMKIQRKNKSHRTFSTSPPLAYHNLLPSSSRSKSLSSVISFVSIFSEPRLNVAGCGVVGFIFNGLWSWKICEFAKTWRISGARFTLATWISRRNSSSWIFELEKLKLSWYKQMFKA